MFYRLPRKTDFRTELQRSKRIAAPEQTVQEPKIEPGDGQRRSQMSETINRGTGCRPTPADHNSAAMMFRSRESMSGGISCCMAMFDNTIPNAMVSAAHNSNATSTRLWVGVQRLTNQGRSDADAQDAFAEAPAADHDAARFADKCDGQGPERIRLKLPRQEAEGDQHDHGQELAQHHEPGDAQQARARRVRHVGKGPCARGAHSCRDADPNHCGDLPAGRACGETPPSPVSTSSLCAEPSLQRRVLRTGCS